MTPDERAALYADMDANPGDYTPNECALRRALDAETARADVAECAADLWLNKYAETADALESVKAKHLSWAIFAIRDHDAYAQPFVLMRDTDVSGVSGTGVVADGVAFPDGTVALRWRGGNPTSVVFHDNGVASVEAIHGHGGNTRIVWLAEDLETTAEVAAAYDALDRVRALCDEADAANPTPWLSIDTTPPIPVRVIRHAIKGGAS